MCDRTSALPMHPANKKAIKNTETLTGYGIFRRTSVLDVAYPVLCRWRCDRLLVSVTANFWYSYADLK